MSKKKPKIDLGTVQLFVAPDSEEAGLLRYGVRTTTENLDAFIDEFCVAFAAAWEDVVRPDGSGQMIPAQEIEGAHEQLLNGLLRQAWPLMCKLAGYKAEGVNERRVMWASQMEIDGKALVGSSRGDTVGPGFLATLIGSIKPGEDGIGVMEEAFSKHAGK
jgi:hypothetical protein